LAFYSHGKALVRPHHLTKGRDFGPYEEFEETKGVIRIRILKKDRQHNGQKKQLFNPDKFYRSAGIKPSGFETVPTVFYLLFFTLL
jgi:hypothetical protein